MNELNVTEIQPRDRHPRIFKAFDDLAKGEAFILVNDHDPKPLWYQFEVEFKGKYGWEYEQSGPKDWIVKIKKTG